MALDPVTAGLSLGSDIVQLIGKFVPDKDKAAELMSALEQGQVDVDKVEAASTNWFVAGWRPALGWVLDACVLLYFVPKFMVASIVYAHDCWAAGGMAGYPSGVDIVDVLSLMGVLLGHSGLRSFDKYAGTAGK